MSTNNSGCSNQTHSSNSANTDSMSDVVIYSFFANQSNSPQLNDVDLQQNDDDDLEEMDLKWQMAMLTMRARRFLNKTGRKISSNGSETIGFNKSKVECYNCHQKGHFTRECRAPRENKNREHVRRNVTVETIEIKALVAQYGLGYDWSDQAKKGPINFALMAYTSSSSYSKVSTCSKACLKSYKTLKEHYDNLIKDFNKSQLNVGAYKAGLSSVEARLDVYKKNEVIFEEDIKILKLDIMLRDNALTELRKKFEKSKKERDDLKLTLEKFENSSKNLRKLLEIQVCDKFKTCVGYDSQVVDSQVVDSQVFDCQENDKYKTSEGYHAVPPTYTGNFIPPKPNLVLADEEEYVFSKLITSVPAVETSKVKTSESKHKESVKKVENNKQAKYARKNSQSPRGNQRNWNNLMTQKLEKTLNTDGQNFKATVSVNTAYPRPIVNSARTSSNVFNRAHLHVRRPFNKSTTNKNNNLNEKVNTVKGNVTTAGPKAVVSDNKGNEANVVKASACWVWRPKQKGNPQLELQEKGVINSGCSRHMTGNKSYLSDYEEIDGGFVAFGGDPKGGKITGKGKISTGKLDFEDVYFVKELKEFSVARTPQQNRVAERKNRTLIEAARTMLADSKLPTTFWAEAVNTACYVQNRVLVIKPHNKTSYELFLGRKPTLSFMRPFGYPVTILNTIDHLGKFDGMDDEGFFVGYSTNSKAFRVFNSRTRIVEENLHVKFSEETPNIAGSGPKWLFDIDALTKSMNYKPVLNLEEIVYSEDDEGVGAEADMNNLDTFMSVSPISTTRIHKDHPSEQIIRDLHSAPQTRRMTKSMTEHAEPKKVCTLVDLPYGKRAIGTKWVYRNKKDERDIVIRNKARLVAQGYTQEEGIDYDEVFALVARIEAIRLFLAYASFKDFVMYQMDVKSAFLYSKIEEEVYVCQPLGFEDLEFPDRVYKVEKALYGLHQAPRAWSKMISMGELTFFLGLQVTHKNDGIFINQDKYVDEILKKFGFSTMKTASTPMETSMPLIKDENAEDVDVHLYRSMIGSLMYLTSLRPDIMFDDSPFNLEAYTDSDYAGASLDRKSTT
ncbi:retrovirus-related pol polyprotein from transposon TNT 1-94 [Tanacetum coccineum]